MAFLAKVLSKVKEYIKPAPWAQYVGLQVALIPGVPVWVSVPALLLSAGAFLVRLKAGLGFNDPKLKKALVSSGYPLAGFGAAAHLPVVLFVGGALVMTEFVYDLIYP